MNKRIRLFLPKQNILFHCLLSCETIQFRNITNSYFFAKGNLAILLCSILPLNYIYIYIYWAWIMGINEEKIRKSIPEQFSDNQEEVA